MLIDSIPLINDYVAKEIVEILQGELAKSRDGQMPMNTSKKLSNSIKAEISGGALSDIEIQSEDYGAYLNKGIPDVPFSPGSGEKKPSEYIKGLTRWVTMKFGVGGIKAKKIAFAIANSQKNNPPAPSNPGWIDDIQDELDRKVKQKLHDYTFYAIQSDVIRILNRTIP